MRKVFNIGIGFCLIAGARDADEILRRCTEMNETAAIIGTVTA